MDTYERLQSCCRHIKEELKMTPKIALVLGSGLGDFAEQVQVEAVVPYQDIEGFPVSTVEGHKGRFVFGTVGEVPVVVMQGRVHYYEGYSMEDVVLPIRVMGMLGAQVLLLTNAAGGANYAYSQGDLMLIKDQISSFVPSPLIGPNLERLGTRFPDMSEIYDRKLRATIKRVASSLSIHLREGIYLQMSGPQFESPAEVNLCRNLGADAIGMSTACEAIAARHMGMRVCGISCISNLACGMTDQPLSDDEVKETAGKIAPLFQQLVSTSIAEIAKAL